RHALPEGLFRHELGDRLAFAHGGELELKSHLGGKYLEAAGSLAREQPQKDQGIMLGGGSAAVMERDAVGLAFDLGLGMAGQELGEALVPGLGPGGLRRIRRTGAPRYHRAGVANGVE